MSNSGRPIELPQTMTVRFGPCEPEFDSFEGAIGNLAIGRQAGVLDISQAVRGRKISACHWGPTELFLTLDDGSNLHVYLSDGEAKLELVSAADSHRHEYPRLNPSSYVLRVESSRLEFVWDTAKIQRRMVGSTVHLCDARHGRVAIDIGRAIALCCSQMFVVELQCELLQFEFDVEVD